MAIEEETASGETRTVDPLAWDSNPLGITFGEPLFETYRGAIVGNLFVIAGFPLVGLGAAYAKSRINGKSFEKLIDELHVPGLIALPLSVLAPATIGAASTMVSYSYNTATSMTGGDLALVTMAAAYGAIAPLALYTWLGSYFRRSGILKDIKEKPKKLESVIDQATHVLSWVMHATQEWKNSAMKERFEPIIEPVSKPFFPSLDLSNALALSLIDGVASQCSYQKCCVVSSGLSSAICAAYLLTHLISNPCLVRFDKATLPSLEAMITLVSAFSLATNLSRGSTNLLDDAELITQIAFYTTWVMTSVAILDNLYPLIRSGVQLIRQRNDIGSNTRRTLTSLIDASDSQELLTIADYTRGRQSEHLRSPHTFQPDNRQVDQPHRQQNAQKEPSLKNNDRASSLAAAFYAPASMTTRDEIFARFNRLRDQRQATQDVIQIAGASRSPRPMVTRKEGSVPRSTLILHDGHHPGIPNPQKQPQNRTFQPDNRQVDQRHRQQNTQQDLPLRNNDRASPVAAALRPPGSMTTRDEIFAHFNQLRAQRGRTQDA